MNRKTFVCAVIVILGITLMSCEKLPTTPEQDKQGLKMESTQLVRSIPSEWGNLIAVSNVSQFPVMVQLWFQDNDGNIYMVPYNVDANVFHDTYRYLKHK